ncbi:uncharacterized protein LOC135112661 [Scylla paramamosain]|uniref:uncharacterized protein LOC135112661 n=1 Tax=Scylla paramamosain TaxID=85552 RepID=UPI0030834369
MCVIVIRAAVPSATLDFFSSSTQGSSSFSFSRMEELLSCSVCCEQYQEKHRHPVVLPRCGHSFCRPCIAFLVKNGCVICPSCRMDQRVETADHLPTEFSLLAITNAQKITKLEMCSRHDVKLSFWCRSCSSPTCGECLFEEHPTHTHKVVKATTHVEEMKTAIKGIADKFSDALDLRERWYHQQVLQGAKAISDAIRTLSILRRDIDDARELVKGVHVVEGIGPTSALAEASKCLGLKWNLKGCQLELTEGGGRQQEREEGKGDGDGKVKEVENGEDEEEEGKVNEEKNEAGKETPAEALAEEVEKTDEEKKPEAEEKEIDELEALTEEEKKKRRKLLRLKEKLAAASAAAEASRDKDKADLKPKAERRSAREKGDREAEVRKENIPESVKFLAAALDKNPRTDRKDARASRDLSTSPPKDDASGKDEHVTSKSELDTEAETEASRKAKRDGDSDPNKAAQASLLTRIEPLPRTKPDPASVLKKPKANTGLKKSKTVTFMVQPEDTTADDAKDDQSDDIRGLDLQVPRISCSDNTDNKEKEKEEKEKEEKEKEKEKEKEEATGTGSSEAQQREERQERKKKRESKKNKEKLFEMEPEEKERIATELLQVPSLTLVVEGIGGRLAYVTWEAMGMHVYCHQYHELPYDLLLKSSVLLSLLPTKAPLVFLDIGTEQKVLGRVYISLWGHLRRAMNFLHLCLGDRGPSFRDSMFLEVMNADCPGERIRGGDYECNNGRGGEALLDDLESEEGYSMPMEAGMITAGGPNRKEVGAQFFICTEDDFDRRFACPFGRVVSGLPIVKETVWLVMTKEVYIRECGVVVEAARI